MQPSIYGNTSYKCLERELFRTDNAVIYYRPQWHEYVVVCLTDGLQRLITNDRNEAEEIALTLN